MIYCQKTQFESLVLPLTYLSNALIFLICKGWKYLLSPSTCYFVWLKSMRKCFENDKLQCRGRYCYCCCTLPLFSYILTLFTTWCVIKAGPLFLKEKEKERNTIYTNYWRKLSFHTCSRYFIFFKVELKGIYVIYLRLANR